MKFLLSIVLGFSCLLCAQHATPRLKKPSLEEVEKFVQDRSVDGIRFDGMFKGINELGPGTLEQLQFLVQQKSKSVGFRLAALGAIGELGDKDAVGFLHEFKNDSELPTEIKDKVGFVLFELGEKQALNQELSNLKIKIKFVKEAPDMATNEKKRQLISLYQKLALLTYGMKMYKESCLAYEGMFIVYPNVEGQLYNYACVLALTGQKEKALDKLAEAIKVKEWTSPKAMEKDGDLRNLREEPRFQKLVQKLKSKLKENY